MNKLTIFVIALLFVISFVVESVTAAESTEVLRARLNLRKNSLKAVESKVDISRVNVGVEEGVGNGVNIASKTAQGLESQTRLVSKNSILRRAPSDATSSPTTTTQATNNANVVTANANANGDATTTTSQTSTTTTTTNQANPQAPPQVTSTVQASPQVTTTVQTPPQATDYNVTSTSTQTTTTTTSQSQAPTNTQNGQTQKEQKVNYTAIIDEYMEQLRIKMEKQMTAMKNAMAAYREAERVHYISKTAKTLTHLQTCQEEIERIIKAEEEFREQQKKKTEENKVVVENFLNQTLQKQAERKKKLQADIEEIIASVNEHLEKAERYYREGNGNATYHMFRVLASLQNAMRRIGEYRFQKLKSELTIRYPFTAAALEEYLVKIEKQFEEAAAKINEMVANDANANNANNANDANANNANTVNPPQTIYKAALVEQKADSKIQELTSSILQSKLQKSQNNDKAAGPNPAVLVALNTNKLKQKLSQLH